MTSRQSSAASNDGTTECGPAGARRLIAALAYPGVQLLDIVGPLETFNLAAQQLVDDAMRPDRAYEVVMVSRDGAAEKAMSGLQVAATRSLADDPGDIDTLLVPGALTGDTAFHDDPDYIDFVRRAGRSVRRVCSVCSGALLLAAAGLLSGRRATTHWMDAAELRDCYPDVHVEADRIWVRDGNVWSSGGITAGIDLALALIEDDHSRSLALKVAKRLLVFLKRPGDQAQFSDFLAAQSRPGRLADVLDWLATHLDQPLSAKDLARRACMSERSFRRHFERALGMPVGRYLMRARVTKARALLEDTGLPVGVVATRCGFPSAGAMRYAFGRELDVTPSAYRERFGAAAGHRS